MGVSFLRTSWGQDVAACGSSTGRVTWMARWPSMRTVPNMTDPKYESRYFCFERLTFDCPFGSFLVKNFWIEHMEAAGPNRLPNTSGRQGIWMVGFLWALKAPPNPRYFGRLDGSRLRGFRLSSQDSMHRIPHPSLRGEGIPMQRMFPKCFPSG